MITPSKLMRRKEKPGKRRLSPHRMNNVKMEMVFEAVNEQREKGLEIVPIPTRGSWDDSFTMYEGWLYLWYNTVPDDSTHVIKRELN